MLNAIVSFSLRFRGSVIALACLLLGYGFQTIRNAKLDVFPDFVQPQVVVQTECPGLSPEQVETLVTRPIELALNGAGSVEFVRSESIPGVSVITVVFKDGTDVYRARQIVAEHLVQAGGRLPAGVKQPVMEALTSSTMDLLKIGLQSTNLSPMELRGFAEWTLKPRLLAVKGVARVNLFGGEVRQLQIQIRPERLRAFGLSISEITAAARLATGVRGAGFVETANQRILTQTEGQSTTPAQLKQVIVGRSNGQSVRLADIADVVEGAEPKFGDALIQGQPGVLLTLASQYGSNTREVTRDVELALAEIRPVLDEEKIVFFDRLHRPATFIETSLENIRSSLFLGAAFVAVVLFVFLFNFRTAFISLTAIPLSLVAALVVLDQFGVSLNTLTLGGLAISLGEVVDDAIIDIENIYRRLRENQLLANPLQAWKIILGASLEVRTAVVYATFVVVLVFVPVMTMTGLQGKFFAPLGIAYVLAILASLVVALTVTPALAALMFGKGVRYTGETWLQRRLKSLYRRLLSLLVVHPWSLAVCTLIVCGSAASLLPFFGGEFLPEFREGHFVIQTVSAPGTSLPESLRIGQRIASALLANTNIATVEQQIGRAEAGEDTWPPHRSEYHVELRNITDLDQEAVQKQIRATLAGFPGISFDVMTFLGDRLSETISGETAAVVVSVYGSDLDVLDRKAKEIQELLAEIPGHADVRFQSPPGSPRVTVRLRPERLQQFGFTPVEIMEAVSTAFEGTVVGQTYDRERITDVAVVQASDQRHDPESVGKLLIQNAEGIRLPLRDLADVDLNIGRDSILHDGARRRQTVTCNVAGRDIASFVDEAKTRIRSSVKLPTETYISFTGVAEQRQAAGRELWLRSGAACIGVVLLLAAVLAHWRNLVLVLANLPFALAGGLFAAYLDSRSLSLGSLVGLVTLFGITTRNSIMLISHLEHLVTVEGQPWSLETVLRGASERLVPILMTALVTALGLLPLALGSGDAGREIEGPMAIVILGGLASSTVLNLLVLPVLSWRFARFAPRQRAPGY